MKNITLKTIRGNELIEESELILRDGAFLVAQIPNDMNKLEAERVHKAVAKMLNGESSHITVREGVTFKVLKVEK